MKSGMLTPPDEGPLSGDLWSYLNAYLAQPLVGTPGEIVEHLGPFAEIGLQRVYLQVLDLSDLEHLRLFADEVQRQL